MHTEVYTYTVLHVRIYVILNNWVARSYYTSLCKSEIRFHPMVRRVQQVAASGHTEIYIYSVHVYTHAYIHVKASQHTDGRQTYSEFARGRVGGGGSEDKTGADVSLVH